MVHSPFLDAFTPRRRFVHEVDGPIEIATKVLGDLKVPTGRIVPCDPLTNEFEEASEPLAGTAPIGVFPVEVAIAKYDKGDTRVACARVRFADRPAVRWQDLGQPDQFTTPEGQAGGYGVDSGTGCFFDASAVGTVDSDEWLAALASRQVPTWSWNVAEIGSANVVMFSTGRGDGLYPTYWGLDADGQVVELVTDFELLIGSTFDRVELPLPLSRGRFRHPLLEKHDITMHVPLLSRSSAIISGHGYARIERPDGTVLGSKRQPGQKWYLPSDLQNKFKPPSAKYSWKDVPELSHVVLAVVTGSKPLDPVSE